MNELTMVNNCLQLSEIHKQLHYKSDLVDLLNIFGGAININNIEIAYEKMCEKNICYVEHQGNYRQVITGPFRSYVLGIVTALEIIRKSKEVSYEQ